MASRPGSYARCGSAVARQEPRSRMKAMAWKGTFRDLDKHKKGQEIKYAVVETTNVNGYTAKRVVEAPKTVMVITNIHTPESVNIEGNQDLE
ncbi:MAG: Cna B-type domain-containing protein [Ruminococcus sp.]